MPQFKVNWQAAKEEPGHGRSQQPAQPSFKQAAGQPQGGEGPDARQRSIIRQHSQSAAIEFLKTCGELPRAGGVPEFTPEWMEIHLAPVIDWLAADAVGMSRAQASDPDIPPF